jgi:hypothetical protein
MEQETKQGHTEGQEQTYFRRCPGCGEVFETNRPAPKDPYDFPRLFCAPCARVEEEDAQRSRWKSGRFGETFVDE